jgi:hypothetical protein
LTPACLEGYLIKSERRAEGKGPLRRFFVVYWQFFEPTMSGVGLRLKSYSGATIIKAGKAKKVGQNERKVEKEKQGIGFCH